jgi:hypothetical protein
LPERGLESILTLISDGITGWGSDRGILIKFSGVIFTLTSIIERPFSFEIFTYFSNLDSSYFLTYSKIQNLIFQSEVLFYGSRIYSALGT